MNIFGFKIGRKKGPKITSVHDLDSFAYAGQQYSSPVESSVFDGNKFPGGMGPVQIQLQDYWAMRAYSTQLFNSNLYARGLIRRLITNEINTGLVPDACPDEEIIGVPEDSLNGWTETVENRFGVWAKTPALCDWKKQSTFGSIQRKARRAALISGDVLVVLRQSKRTNLPSVQLVPGNRVRTPLVSQQTPRAGHDIRQGVEFDAQSRPIAYWIEQEDGSSKRLPAFGEKSGRRIAWLVFGTDKLLDDVRGQPLLTLVLQSLSEIDKYRDSVQRKAFINSMLAMFIKKTEDKPGTLPVSNGALRRGSVELNDSPGGARQFNIAKSMPGMVFEELQTGEEPVGFDNQGVDTAFGDFESAIMQAVAWANEIPPEILTLAFSNNYSASQAAINEFKIYLNKVWSDFGETFCTPIYTDWLISQTLLQKVSAPGFLESWRDPSKLEVFAAWLSTDWYGSIKPSTDMLKQAKGSKLLVDEGWTTNSRESRMLTGTKFSKNIKRLKRENQLKVEAAMPLAEFNRTFGTDAEDISDVSEPDLKIVGGTDG